MTDSDELDVERLARRASHEFDKRVIELGPFTELDYDPVTWCDAVVFVRAGAVEIDCADNGRARFRSGDILCLAPFAVRVVRNPSAEPACLFVISRCPVRRTG
jgi:hypothetical protein